MLCSEGTCRSHYPGFRQQFAEQTSRGVNFTCGDNFVSKPDEFALEFMLRIRIGLFACSFLEEVVVPNLVN